MVEKREKIEQSRYKIIISNHVWGINHNKITWKPWTRSRKCVLLYHKKTTETEDVAKFRKTEYNGGEESTSSSTDPVILFGDDPPLLEASSSSWDLSIECQSSSLSLCNQMSLLRSLDFASLHDYIYHVFLRPVKVGSTRFGLPGRKLFIRSLINN